MDDGAALEKRSPFMRSVGSNPTLSASLTSEELIPSRRGAGVAYQARLESVCRLTVTVGSNPTLSASFIFKSYPESRNLKLTAR